MLRSPVASFAPYLLLVLHACLAPPPRVPVAGPPVAFGAVLNSVERGARIYCPVRLLPRSHPDALGHDFPNPPYWHRSEAEALIALGEQVGLGLAATVTRYPGPVTDEWPYPEICEPSPEAVSGAEVVEGSADGPPLPGLRAVAFSDRRLSCFLIDTRGLTLEERGMTRPTSMGLDLSRAQFLERMEQIGRTLPAVGDFLVVYSAPEPDPADS